MQYDDNIKYKSDNYGNNFVSKTSFGSITIIPIKNICEQVGCIDIFTDDNLQVVVHFNTLIKSI